MPSDMKDREVNRGRSTSSARSHVATTAVGGLHTRAGREGRAVRTRGDALRRTRRPGLGPVVECGTSAATVPAGAHHEVSGWM